MTSWGYSYKESYYQLSNSTAGSGYDINATQVEGWTYIEKPVKDSDDSLEFPEGLSSNFQVVWKDFMNKCGGGILFWLSFWFTASNFTRKELRHRIFLGELRVIFQSTFSVKQMGDCF